MGLDNRGQMVQHFQWSTEVVIITIVGMVVVLAAITSIFLTKWPPGIGYLKYIIGTPLLLVVAYLVSCAPVRLKLDDKGVKVKKVIGSIVIPLPSIENIEVLPSDAIRGSIRTFGSGGLFGYLGRFKNDRLGSYRMYATNRQDLILIRTTNTSYVISCHDATRFVNEVKRLREPI